jgi:hypothetical protein
VILGNTVILSTYRQHLAGVFVYRHPHAPPKRFHLFPQPANLAHTRTPPNSFSFIRLLHTSLYTEELRRDSTHKPRAAAQKTDRHTANPFSSNAYKKQGVWHSQSWLCSEHSRGAARCAPPRHDPNNFPIRRSHGPPGRRKPPCPSKPFSSNTYKKREGVVAAHSPSGTDFSSCGSVFSFSAGRQAINLRPIT